MILLLSIAASQATPPLTAAECRSARVQSDLTLCARQDFEKADAELNRLWTGLVSSARQCDRSTDCGRTNEDQRSEEAILKQGQRAWLQFRDAECEYEGLDERGGSMEPMIVNQCLARLTRERIKQLSSGEK